MEKKDDVLNGFVELATPPMYMFFRRKDESRRSAYDKSGDSFIDSDLGQGWESTRNRVYEFPFSRVGDFGDFSIHVCGILKLPNIQPKKRIWIALNIYDLEIMHI